MRTSTHIHPLDEDLYLIRVDDRRSKYFEGVWPIPEGVTYNAYLLKTTEGAILFDTVKEPFTEAFLEALWSLVRPEEIRHIVVHHMEPDHSGALPAVLEATQGRPEVWGHPFTKRLLESMYDLKPSFRPVKDGTTLTFGGERLVFYQTPWLHWPETMVTYLPARQTLLTGDIFGGFGIPEDLFDDRPEVVEAFLPLARKYFATVVGHYKEHVLKHLPRLEQAGVRPQRILPAHGLLWRQEPQRVVQAYLDWAQGTPTPGKVVIGYTSMYRYAEAAIQWIVEILQEHGITPKVYRYVDDHHDNTADFLGELPDAALLILGTATYEGTMYLPMKQLIEEIVHKANYAKPVLLVSAYGWAGAAGKEAARLLEGSAYHISANIEYRGKLREPERQAIREALLRLIAPAQKD